MLTERLRITSDPIPSVEDVSIGYINHPVADFQTYSVFDVSGNQSIYTEAAQFRKQQLESFRDGSIRNPILNNCPDFEEGREIRRSMYLQVRSLFNAQQLRATENSERTLEVDMIDANIALKINELGFIETAALLAANSLKPDESAKMAELLRDSGQDIYGLPDRGIALTLLAKRLNDIALLSQVNNEFAQSIAQYVVEHVSIPEDYTPTPFLKLDEAALAHYEKIILYECRGDVEAAFRAVPKNVIYSPEDMQHIYNKYLDLRGFTASGWQAQVIEGRTGCLTNLTDSIVEIGAARPATSRGYTAVLKTMIHEIEVHVGKSVRGQRLGTGLAGKGLAGYTFFEEPFAGSVEDIYLNKTTQRGEPYTIAIALSAGMDGKARDYRDSYELLWRMSFARSYSSDKPISYQVNKAQKNANSTLVRIWRGMPTDIPGCIFTKDRSYENTDVLMYLNNGGSVLPRQDFLRLLSAKYDPRNPLQDAYIRQFHNG
jgi:hypothetical protein